MTKFSLSGQDKQYARTSILVGAVSGAAFGTVLVVWLLIAYMVFAPSMARYGARKVFEAIEQVNKEMYEEMQLKIEEDKRMHREIIDDMDRYRFESRESYLNDFDDSILDRAN